VNAKALTAIAVLVITLFVSIPARAQTAPPAPTGVTATGSETAIYLSWTAVTGATQYKVKRSLSSGGPYALLETVTAISYTDSNVTAGTTYYYVVTAANLTGESANSSQVSAAAITPPTTPSSLTATAGDTRVLLSWGASARVVSYEVWRSAAGAAWTRPATVTGATSYVDTGLTNGSSYDYYILAKNGGGSSPHSNQVGITPSVVSQNAPGAATFGTITANSIQVNAPALPFNAATLTLQRKAGTIFANVATGLAGSAVTTVSELSANSAYTFRYVSVGTGASTPGSEAATSTLEPVPAEPGTPTVSRADATVVAMAAPPVPVYADTLKLQQKLAADPATSYVTVFTITQPPSPPPVQTISPSATGLTANTAYTFRYLATTTGGSTAGAETSVTTAPAAPGLPTFTNVASSSMTLVAPSTGTGNNLPSGAASLTLQLKLAVTPPQDDPLNFPYQTLATGLAPSQQTAVTGLISGQTYIFRYVSVGTNGQTSGTTDSQATSTTPAANAPGPPVFLTVAGTSVVLTSRDSIPGSAPSGPSWTVQKKLQTDPNTAYVTCTGSISAPMQLRFTASGLTAATGYNFRFVAADGTLGAAAAVTTAAADIARI